MNITAINITYRDTNIHTGVTTIITETYYYRQINQIFYDSPPVMLFYAAKEYESYDITTLDAEMIYEVAVDYWKVCPTWDI